MKHVMEYAQAVVARVMAQALEREARGEIEIVRGPRGEHLEYRVTPLGEQASLERWMREKGGQS